MCLFVIYFALILCRFFASTQIKRAVAKEFAEYIFNFILVGGLIFLFFPEVIIDQVYEAPISYTLLAVLICYGISMNYISNIEKGL